MSFIVDIFTGARTIAEVLNIRSMEPGKNVSSAADLIYDSLILSARIFRQVLHGKSLRALESEIPKFRGKP